MSVRPASWDDVKLGDVIMVRRIAPETGVRYAG